MATRICDLAVQIPDSPVGHAIDRLYDELDRRGIGFHPPCYLTDEWGCPDGVPIIGVPFYMADPVLTALERETMLDAEGDEPAEMMKLLRHEAGHAVNYAFHLHRRAGWDNVFGPFDTPYPEHFKKRRYSKRYVQHLAGWYAQRHPDEDFAETFAVWLSPVGDWRRRYAGWGALRKLEWVERAVQSIAGRRPRERLMRLDRPVEEMTLTLAHYYRDKRDAGRHDFPDIYDARLREIFPRARAPGAIAAADYLRLKRREYAERVARWTGERRYVIGELYTHLIARCRKLRLWTRPSRVAETAADVAAFLATLIMNYVYRGTFTNGHGV